MREGDDRIKHKKVLKKVDFACQNIQKAHTSKSLVRNKDNKKQQNNNNDNKKNPTKTTSRSLPAVSERTLYLNLSLKDLVAFT